MDPTMHRPASSSTVPHLETRLSPLGAVTAANRTMDVIFTTGATVRRSRRDGYNSIVSFDEVLLVSDAAIDLTRLRAGAPVLDSHQANTIGAQLAVVDDAWVLSDRGYARIRFPEKGTDAQSDRLFDMVQQKIVRNISVGYAINRVRIVAPQKAGEVERRIVERWTPYELSFVTVPADAGAQTRSQISIWEAARTRMRMRQRLIL